MLNGNGADYSVYQVQGPFAEFGPDDLITGVMGITSNQWADVTGVELFQFADGTYTTAELFI